VNFIERHLKDPIRFARIKYWFYLSLAVVVLSEIVALIYGLIFGMHPHFWFEWIPAWGSLYGFVSCAVIIIVSKFIGKKWLMRREDYYDS